MVGFLFVQKITSIFAHHIMNLQKTAILIMIFKQNRSKKCKKHRTIVKNTSNFGNIVKIFAFFRKAHEFVSKKFLLSNAGKY